MLLKKKLVATLAIAALGVIQFLLCVWFGMVNYDAPFSLAENFLSELGRTTYNYGYVFNVAMMVLGLSQVPLFVMLAKFNPDDLVSMKIASWLGVVSSFGIVGLGLTPENRLYVLHHVALVIWLFPMLFCWVFFYFAASRSPYVGIGFLSLSLIVVVAMIGILLRANMSGFELLQKVVIVCALIWLAFVFGFVCLSGYVVLKSEKLPVETGDAYAQMMKRNSRRMNR